jgi:hypothetical protein
LDVPPIDHVTLYEQQKKEEEKCTMVAGQLATHGAGRTLTGGCV